MRSDVLPSRPSGSLAIEELESSINHGVFRRRLEFPLFISKNMMTAIKAMITMATGTAIPAASVVTLMPDAAGAVTVEVVDVEVVVVVDGEIVVTAVSQ